MRVKIIVSHKKNAEQTLKVKWFKSIRDLNVSRSNCARERGERIWITMLES
jgi:hypothetical protein